MNKGFIEQSLDGFNHQQINFAAKIGGAVVWKYKFLYLYQGAEVGTASLVIEVLVTGRNVG